ncbi:MAG: alpha/beta hydrolase [Hahellaceae bacterium]|nr:alpha/beta hydrolase [Hahellaceae bacterium]MCP5169351.1 alpha/beta hydrolase [Hahellaceae bacterium]
MPAIAGKMKSTETTPPAARQAPVSTTDPAQGRSHGTWVLIRGLLREQRHWGRFPDLMRKAMPHCKILTLDVPGNGSRHQEASPLNIAAAVEQLRETLSLMPDLKKPLNLLGISMGGMMVVDWAQRYPEEVNSAVLINTSLSTFSPFYHRLRAANYPRILRALWLNKQSQESLILEMTSNKESARRQALGEWIHIAQSKPVSKRNLFRQMVAAGRFNPPDTAPAVPMLMLASEHDRIVDVSCSQRMAKAWQVRLKQHQRAGHDLPLDAPWWVIYQIKEWH